MPQPIVLIHGLWMTPKSWEGWAERFRAKGHEVITPGWSDAFDRSPEDLRRDPSALAGLTAAQVADRYEQAIRALPEPPIIMGHSFGGLFTQVMLNRGLGAAGVGVDAAQPKGVLKLPFSTIKSSWGIIRNPANRGKAVPFTPKQFKYAFGNLLSEEESQKAWETYAIPGVGHVFMEGANANLSPEVGVQDRLREGRPRAAAPPRRRQGSRRSGRRHADEREEVQDGSRGDQGVPRPLALDGRPGRLGSGRRPRARLGDEERQELARNGCNEEALDRPRWTGRRVRRDALHLRRWRQDRRDRDRDGVGADDGHDLTAAASTAARPRPPPPKPRASRTRSCPSSRTRSTATRRS